VWRDLLWQALDYGVMKFGALFCMEHVPSHMTVCHQCKALVDEVRPVWVGSHVLRACVACAAGRTPAEKNANGEWLVEYFFPGGEPALHGPWAPGATDGRLAVHGVTWMDQLSRVRRAMAEVSRWQIRKEPGDDDEGCMPLGPWESDNDCWSRPLAEPTSPRSRGIPSEVLCNSCGKSCRVAPLDAPEHGSAPFYGLINVVARGHYLSPVLPDMCTYRFSLCESCLADLFDRCKIPPEGLCVIDNAPAPAWRASD
jgi:hypothetical protein